MEKANKVLRRSGIRLRSVKSGHASLKLIISDWKESRNAYKSYIANQETSWSDKIKWASTEHNKGLKEVIENVNHLQKIWTDVQTQFISALKKFQNQFEAILESELQLDRTRANLNSYEQKELKFNKELRKARAKSSVEDLKQIEEKLADVKIFIQNAKLEVEASITENESLKLLLIKEGLLNLSKHYIELADKTAIIFKAHRNMAATLPDAHNSFQDLRFNGSETLASTVAQVTQELRNYNDSGGSISVPPAPPPYCAAAQTPPDDALSILSTNPPRYYNYPPAFSPTHASSPSHQFHMNEAGSVTTTRYYDVPPDSYGNLPLQMNQMQMNS